MVFPLPLANMDHFTPGLSSISESVSIRSKVEISSNAIFRVSYTPNYVHHDSKTFYSLWSTTYVELWRRHTQKLGSYEFAVILGAYHELPAWPFRKKWPSCTCMVRRRWRIWSNFITTEKWLETKLADSCNCNTNPGDRRLSTNFFYHENADAFDRASFVESLRPSIKLQNTQKRTWKLSWVLPSNSHGMKFD